MNQNRASSVVLIDINRECLPLAIGLAQKRSHLVGVDQRDHGLVECRARHSLPRIAWTFKSNNRPVHHAATSSASCSWGDRLAIDNAGFVCCASLTHRTTD